MNKPVQGAGARKDKHLDLAYQSLPDSDNHPMDSIELPYCALPEISLDEVSLTTSFLGAELSAPVMITAMTGGSPRADRLNLTLAELAQNSKVALGLGSQRASLEQGKSQKNLRKAAPDIPLIGNLGGVQLAAPGGIELALRAADDIEADALAIHLNPLQEAIQPEGETDWRGVLDKLEALMRTLPCPLIVKEVGAGLSAPLVAQLASIGVNIVDIAGRSGTNWARIEAARRTDDTAWLEPFLDIGINTPDAIYGARAVSDQLCVIGSGGLRHGLDAAKAIMLGADIAGMAGAVLRAAEDKHHNPTPELAQAIMDDIKRQITLSCFLAGARKPVHLRQKQALRP